MEECQKQTDYRELLLTTGYEGCGYMKSKRNMKKQKAVLGSIRGKLAVSYLILIVLIVALGIISYRRAAGTIIANYEVSMETAIRKTSEYYELMMDTIAVNCSQIAINNTLRAYYRGAYRGSRCRSNWWTGKPKAPWSVPERARQLWKKGYPPSVYWRPRQVRLPR